MKASRSMTEEAVAIGQHVRERIGTDRRQALVQPRRQSPPKVGDIQAFSGSGGFIQRIDERE